MGWATRAWGLLGAMAMAAMAVTVAAQPTRSVWDGVYTDEQANRGEETFTAVCAECHGPSMEGGETAPSLADGAFAANWNDLTLGDMFDRIRVSMPPDDPDRVTRQEVADVMALILRTNRFPAGEKELPRRSEMLQMILYEAQAP